MYLCLGLPYIRNIFKFLVAQGIRKRFDWSIMYEKTPKMGLSEKNPKKSKTGLRFGKNLKTVIRKYF